MFDIGTQTNVYENLHALRPFRLWLPALTALVPLLEAKRDSWLFATDGTSGAPTLEGSEEITLDGNSQAALRTLSFIDKPPALSSRLDINALRLGIFTGTRCAQRPTAIVMAGPPGAEHAD